MQDKHQRTEKPSPQKIRKARQEGRFPTSREFVGGIQFFVFVAILVSLAPRLMGDLRSMFIQILSRATNAGISAASLPYVAQQATFPVVAPLVLIAAAVFFSGLAAQLSITGFGVSINRLSIDWSRLNPAQRMKDMPRQNFAAMIECLVLLPLLLFALSAVVASRLQEFLLLPLIGVNEGISRTGGAVATLLWHGAVLLLLWGCVDFLRKRRKYISDLMMTKQEVREEWRQNEGSPEIKLRIRRMRRELLKRRMMSEVPTATAIVVNPTHYAVALRYNMQDMSAPRVVAKGRNYLAKRIREKGLAHHVPVIENRPLAQALYKNCDVGQEIPAHLYRAVAEVLAYVYRLTGGGSPGRGV